MISSQKIDNLYLYGIKAVIFLIPFLPLYVSTSLVFPYIAGKNFAFRILVELAAVLWMGLMYANKEFRFRNSAITMSILTFTFIVGLADLLGVNPYKSFWSNYERMEGYITILHLALYFMIIRSVIRTAREWTILINIFVIISFLVSIYALIAPLPVTDSSKFAIEYGRRIYGTVGNPPFLASYLLMSVFLGLILIFKTQRVYLKFIYPFLIIINLITIYQTSSRGAILGAIIAIIMFSFLFIFGRTNVPRGKSIRWAALSVIGIVIVLSVAFVILRNADFVKHDRTLSRFANIFSDASVQTRLNAWKMGWEGVKERPFLGWGQENFISVYTVNPIPFVEPQIWLDRAHNILIDWLINAGILGLFSYLAILGAAFYILRIVFQQKIISENEVLTIAAALSAYFIQNLFTFDTINTYLLFFTLLAYIDHVYNPEKSCHLKGFVDSGKSKIRSVIVILPALLISSFLFYHLNYKPIKEIRLYIQTARSSSPNDSYLDLLDNVNKVLSFNTFGDDLVRQGMSRTSFRIIKNKLYAQKGAMEFIASTVEELERGISVNSYDLEYLAGVISIYRLIALYEPAFIDKTEAVIKKCISLNPDYQWPYMELADIYVMKKNYEGAYINVKKITDLDPLNDKKQFRLALAAIYSSRDDIVKSSLENVEKIRSAGNKNIASGRESVFSAAELYRIARVYMEKKNLREALRYYKELIAVLSDDDKLNYNRDISFHAPEVKAKIHIEIAEIYTDLGYKRNAIEEAGKAAALDPQHQLSRESYLYIK